MHGTRTQYKEALEVMLPTSTLYDFLEGRVPNPAYTYTKVVEIVEAEEKERINKEIGERRTRLGAKIGQITTEVKREVLEGSNLEHLYNCIIDWTGDDDLRRLYEEKVLQRAYDTLLVLPFQRKSEKREQVQKLAQGLVILKHPFALAWRIVLEWKDAERLEEWDPGLLREYTELFPDDGLTKVLSAYLESEISPFPKPEKTANTEENQKEVSLLINAEDRLLLMTEGVEESSRSVMSQRLIGEYFLYLEEYSSAVDAAKKARDLLALETEISGLPFEYNVDAVNIILGTALVQHEAPRNHPEARALFEGILLRKPQDTSALIGIGLILEEEEDYNSAADFLDRALKRNQDVKVKAEKAWCIALNGHNEVGLHELETCLTEMTAPDVRTKYLKSQTLYRIGVCLWNLDTSKTARKDRNGAYARFLTSLQANLNYAPAYTSLGIYYADYAKDKKRARKCFQKAFELSASEVEAAERLARAFADQAEWDLVEVVAQCVADSGKVRPPPGSKRKGLSWPFAALGVVQLNNQDYARSIVSFQSALRIFPEDFHCWVGLGEGYHNSGRYIAATRAFEQAQKLGSNIDRVNPDDTWFSKYMLANVRRELGDFSDAVVGYEAVLASRPNEFGVSIALLQTHVESAWRSVELGFFGRAVSSVVESFRIAQDIAKHHDKAFNLWKAVGDACTVFSWVQAYVSDCPVEKICSMLEAGANSEVYEMLADIDETGYSTLKEISITKNKLSTVGSCMGAAILAHKRAVHVCANDFHAQAVAWFNLGWTEYRAHVCLAGDLKTGTKKKSVKYLKASIRCFKRAIELEASNSEFWNALGIATTQLNPKVSQHAFIRSLYLNDKSARAWTNLGALYLLQNDYQLANDAFTRAQSADPDYAHAWLGQGILAMLLGEAREAQSLFTHAFEISDSSSLIIKRHYALSTFDHLLSSQVSPNQVSDLLQPLLALHQLKSQASSDIIFQHLSSLFAERICNYPEATTILTSVCNRVEAEYEVSESPEALAHFAQAKADLARAQLAVLNFAAAAENAETCLDLSADEDSGSPDPVTRRKYRLSAHLTAGLAYHYTGETDQAITMFRTALEETNANPDTVCVLVQVLWAKGGKEERDVAREQLFDCVEKHPGHVGSITLLGVIALLDDDKDTIEAVAADLHTLRVADDVDTQQRSKIGRVLRAIATTTDHAELAEARTAVMLAPFQSHGWSQMADLAAEETNPSDMALLTAMATVPPKGFLDAEALSEAYTGTSRPADAQRAIILAPWMAQGWEVLA